MFLESTCEPPAARTHVTHCGAATAGGPAKTSRLTSRICLLVRCLDSFLLINENRVAERPQQKLKKDDCASSKFVRIHQSLITTPSRLEAGIPKRPSHNINVELSTRLQLVAASLELIHVPVRPQKLARQESCLGASKPNNEGGREGD